MKKISKARVFFYPLLFLNIFLTIFAGYIMHNYCKIKNSISNHCIYCYDYKEKSINITLDEMMLEELKANNATLGIKIKANTKTNDGLVVTKDLENTLVQNYNLDSLIKTDEPIISFSLEMYIDIEYLEIVKLWFVIVCISITIYAIYNIAYIKKEK